MRDTFITYEGLPINSGGAHSLGKQSVDKIYADTNTFLTTYTTNPKPKEIELIFYSSIKGEYKTFPILFDLMKTFGYFPKWSSYDFPGKKQRLWSWTINENQLETAKAFLKKYENLPDNEYGPIILSSLWHFKFIDNKTKQILPDQNVIPTVDKRQHNSQLYLRLGKKSTMAVWFAFPFSLIDQDKKQYLDNLSKSLPFKLSEKHWRQWRNVGGSWKSELIEINAY